MTRKLVNRLLAVIAVVAGLSTIWVHPRYSLCGLVFSACFVGALRIWWTAYIEAEAFKLRQTKCTFPEDFYVTLADTPVSQFYIDNGVGGLQFIPPPVNGTWRLTGPFGSTREMPFDIPEAEMNQAIDDACRQRNNEIERQIEVMKDRWL